jgi:hypothetical protein
LEDIERVPADKGVPVTQSWRRTPTVGEWTILQPPEFQTIDNGDSWQTYSGGRVFYVSSLRVGDPGASRTPAAALRATAARTLPKQAARRLSHEHGAVCGDAEIRPEGKAWQLKGFMCADGVVATCVADYPSQDDEAWAVAMWESLDHP